MFPSSWTAEVVVKMTTFNFDFSALSGYYNAQINLRLASTLSVGPQSSASAASQSTATAQSELPWRQEFDADSLLRTALGAASFLPNSVAQDARSERGDVSKIFAAYEALNQVKAIADAANEDRLPVGQSQRAEKRMLEGIAEVRAFLDSVDFEKSTLLPGERISKAESEVAIRRSTSEYTTKTLHEGTFDDPVAAFADNDRFTMAVTKSGVTTDVVIDLNEMEAATGQTVRNLDNVAELINLRLEEAGMRTRFERIKVGIPDEDGVIQGDQFGFKVKGVSIERINFSADDAAPAAIMVGQSGGAGNSAGQLSAWTDLDSAEAVRALATRYGEEEQDTNFTAVAAHPDGGYIVTGTSSGAIGSGSARGEQDAFIARFDSRGKEIWSRALGAGTDAEGLGLAVSSTGQIALTGRTADELTTNAIGGQDDGFLTVFDNNGIEQWTRQRGSLFDDQANTVAFTSDGGIVMAGQTASSLTEDALLGGEDSYIEKLDASGNREWIRQFGSAGDDAVNAVQVASDGSIVTAGVENGEAVVRRFAGGADDPDDWTLSLGDTQKGAVSALAIGGDGSIYIGGATRADTIDATGLTGGIQSDRDGFVAKITPGAGTATLDWTQRIGGAGYQSVEGLSINGDQVLVTGTGEAEFGSGTSDKDQSAYLTSLDTATGTQGWTNSISGRGGVASASDVVISENYSKTLDAFGLPDGELITADSAAITDRLPLRTGDHFFISIDGGRDRKITIEQGDTLRALSFKVNAALLLNGSGDVRRGTDGQRLTIEPRDGVKLELKAGAEGQDALAALGLTEGFVMKKPVPGDDNINDAPEIVTMGLRSDLSFDTKESREEAVEVLDGALRALRTSYRWAIDDPTLLSLRNGDDGPGANRGGAVPAYLQSQIANLQAGLQRLTAGGGGVNFFA